MADMTFEIKEFPSHFYRAPDGSQIRELPRMPGASLAHCTLETGLVSQSVAHRSVTEIWYFIAGQGQVWLKQDSQARVVNVYPRLSLTIPTGTHFQFRSTGDELLCFLIVTTPCWPGLDEAYRVADYWPIS